MDSRRLRGGRVRQAGPHLDMEGLAQFGGGRGQTATPAESGSLVGRGAEEVPEQGQHFVLHNLRLARVDLCHKF